MIPSRWSSAIAILRRRLAAAEAERRQEGPGLRDGTDLGDRLPAGRQLSDRQRAHLFLRGRDERTIAHDLLRRGEVGGEETVPVEPGDPAP